MKCVSFLSFTLILTWAVGPVPVQAAVRFTAQLDASQTVVPSASPAKGTCAAVLNGSETELAVNCTHNVAGATAAHIHHAPPGQPGPVAFGLGDGLSPIETTWMNPSAEFVGELFAGNLYINVHSTEFPGGAIRGQLTADPFDLQHSLYFPQFGNGGGLTSDIVLQNLSDTDVAHGQIRFFDPEGGPFEVGIEGDSIRSEVDFSIAPLDAITVSTDGSGGEALAGSAVALSDGLLGGVIRFEIAGVGIAGVGAASSETRVMMPVRKEGMGINTGVAARNTSDKAITIQAALLRGGEEVEQANLDLLVDGRVSQFIDDIFPDSVGLDYSGTLVLSCADGSFAAIALELDSKARLFTTLPVSPLP